MKYNIDIIGTCCSRELFNTSKLSEIFTVQNYVFQTLIWACFFPGLNIDLDLINKTHNANFTKRMMNFDLNKEGLNAVLRKKSEYIMVDLTSLTFSFCRCSYKGKETFARNFEQPNCFKELQRVCCDFNYVEYDYSRAEQENVKKGLKELAQWIKKYYCQDKIIINVSEYATHWLNKEYRKKEYSNDLRDSFKKKNAYLKEAYAFFIEQFDASSIKVLRCIDGKTSRNYNLTEDFSGLHYLKDDNEKQADVLIDMLNIDYDKFRTRDLSGLSYWAEKDSTSLRVINRKLWEQSTKSLPMIMHYELIKQNEINSYFNALKAIENDDLIICFAVRDSASKYIDKVENFDGLNFHEKIKYRQAYACIDSIKDNLIIESKTQENFCAVSHVFSPQFSIKVCSKAYSVALEEKSEPTHFEVVQDGNVYKYVATVRGLNVLVWSRKYSGLVDFFGVDLHGDPGMEIIR